MTLLRSVITLTRARYSSAPFWYVTRYNARGLVAYQLGTSELSRARKDAVKQASIHNLEVIDQIEGE